MKTFTTLFLGLIILAGCQSNSYYAAQNTNQKRFDGWNREDAEFLMTTHDRVLLSEALSETAEAKANLRETYVLAQDVQDIVEDLLLKFKLEAAVKRVKLASALSEPSDEYVQKLETIKPENFDVIYYQYLNKALSEINQKADRYISEGHTPRIKEFAKDLKDSIAPILARTEKTDLS